MSQTKRNISRFCPLSNVIKEKKGGSFQVVQPFPLPRSHCGIHTTCTKERALDRSTHTIDIYRRPGLYLCGYFISGSSGTTMRGKGLSLLFTNEFF
jgi:hypothetical protein